MNAISIFRCDRGHEFVMANEGIDVEDLDCPRCGRVVGLVTSESEQDQEDYEGEVEDIDENENEDEEGENG